MTVRTVLFAGPHDGHELTLTTLRPVLRFAVPVDWSAANLSEPHPHFAAVEGKHVEYRWNQARKRYEWQDYRG